MNQALEFSVVVPVHNEAGNVATLIGEIAKALDGRAFEMVFVDDASTDDTRAQLVALKAKYPMLRVLGHRKNAGQSRAIRSGILAAKEGKALITLKLFRQWEGEKHSVDFRALTVDVTGQGKGQVDLKILTNEVTLGTIFTVTLEENASTGYTWQYLVLGDGIMEKNKEISVDKSDKVGAPSKVTWTFQAVDEGYSTIIFRYFRSWEGKESAVDYKAYNISVK